MGIFKMFINIAGEVRVDKGRDSYRKRMMVAYHAEKSVQSLAFQRLYGNNKLDCVDTQTQLYTHCLRCSFSYLDC